MRAVGSSSSSPIRIGFLLGAGTVAGSAAAQHRPDPRDHLAGAEGLDHVVVGAQLEADDAVHLGAARGQHHDRHVGAPAQLAADVAAVAVGEAEVENDQVGLGLGGQLQRPGGGSGD